jgi:hypothetical protein
MSRLQVTKVQVKNALNKAALENVQYELRGRGQDWHVECADRRTSVLVKRAMRKAGIYAGGYMAGWGGWVYDNVDRSSYAYTCDFNDKASIHHY